MKKPKDLRTNPFQEEGDDDIPLSPGQEISI